MADLTLGSETVANGDSIGAGYLNNSTKLLGIDTGSDTWNQGDTAYTEIATVACATSTFDYAIIIVNVDFVGSGTEPGGASTFCSPYVEIQVGEGGSEAQVAERFKQVEVTMAANGSVAFAESKTFIYIHTLTAGEKSNGFNVIVNGKYVVTNGDTKQSTHYQTIVMGTQ